MAENGRDAAARLQARLDAITGRGPAPSIANLEERYAALTGKRPAGPSAEEIAKMSPADRLVSQMAAAVELERKAEAARQQKLAALEAGVDRLWIDSLPNRSDEQLKHYAEHYDRHIERLENVLKDMTTAKGQQGIQQQLDQAKSRLTAVRSVMRDRGIKLIRSADNASLQGAEYQLSRELRQLESQRGLFKSEKYSAKHQAKIDRAQAFLDAARGELARRGVSRLTTPQTPTARTAATSTRARATTQATPTTPTTTSSTAARQQRQPRTVTARRPGGRALPRSRQVRALVARRAKMRKLVKSFVNKAKAAKANHNTQAYEGYVSLAKKAIEKWRGCNRELRSITGVERQARASSPRSPGRSR